MFFRVMQVLKNFEFPHLVNLIKDSLVLPDSISEENSKSVEKW